MLVQKAMQTDATEAELLTGMCNCYETCREGFEGTVRMVARARGLGSEEAKRRLFSMKAKYASSEDYKRLRARLPAEFPL